MTGRTERVPGRIFRTLLAAGALVTASPAIGEEGSWWLNVFFEIDGEWRPGHEIDGWSPREYGSRAECAERKAYAEARCTETPLDYPTSWFCSPGKPMDEPPEELRGIMC
ncbi:hypothetical protein [Oricola sp.]|uniref:hypothetical protein n=1 Tax=Oricola sp. TaxID=1979950 RepID=UPI0025F79740|nr:hypothetical protein [Oricola sp.]MCI5077252.1 hypothetical protein [Oricola sp.]